MKIFGKWLPSLPKARAFKVRGASFVFHIICRLGATHPLRICHQPNCLVKPTPTSSACWYPPCFALRCGLPRALGLLLPALGHAFNHERAKRHGHCKAALSVGHALKQGFKLSNNADRLLLSSRIIVTFLRNTK